VCVEYRNPVHVITKSALVERDLDLLAELHRRASVGVSVSVTFWDAEVARLVEPYAPAPQRRVETIRRLSAAGIPVLLHVAPLIPGLSDQDLIPILEAARHAGAISAMTMPVRLPGAVAAVFEERLQRDFPLRALKVLGKIREMRGGALNDPNFFTRQRGSGAYAQTLERVFQSTARRLGYGAFPEADSSQFQRPRAAGQQLRLF
jgi:DNA repair photolyase